MAAKAPAPQTAADKSWPPPQGEWTYEDYRLVDPETRTIEVNVLRGQAYAALGLFTQGQLTRSELLPDFQVPVDDVFKA
jgi:Uma2 family endonuclease